MRLTNSHRFDVAGLLISNMSGKNFKRSTRRRRNWKNNLLEWNNARSKKVSLSLFFFFFFYIYIYYYSEERTIILVQCCETYWSYITSGNSRRQVYGWTLTRVKIICTVRPEYLKVVWYNQLSGSEDFIPGTRTSGKVTAVQGHLESLIHAF